MNEEVIRDFYGRIIGYIKTEPNGNKTAYNFYRQKLGTYDKSKNITKDFYGRVTSKGDTLTSLITIEELKREKR